jgi:superfamily II DNA/RNA helicase
MDAILEIFESFGLTQTMIFVHKKKDAETLQEFIQSKGYSAEKLIGGITQLERDKVIDAFRETNINTLISTNVLARGIDVPEVDLVINYEVPFISDSGWKLPDYANFLHRVGRTGRFGTDGVSVTFVSRTDEVQNDLLNDIEQYYDIKIEPVGNLGEIKYILE